MVAVPVCARLSKEIEKARRRNKTIGLMVVVSDQQDITTTQPTLTKNQDRITRPNSKPSKPSTALCHSQQREESLSHQLQ
jgi:hypothetical protein